jgi:CRP-like cAMP-binding protein
MLVKLLTRKLNFRDSVSQTEQAALEAAVARTEDYAARSDIIREGERPSASSLLIEGMAARYTILPDGARQITAIHIGGDFVDLHSFLIKKMDHGVLALTPCRIAKVPHENLRELSERHPHLSRLLWLSTLIDAAIFRQWLVAMGRRSAEAQMAHFFCELLLRHRITGIALGDSFPLPITQGELADALGLSAVHVNRLLKELRASGLIAWREGVLSILDFGGLGDLAGFDPTYLVLDRAPR